MALRASRHQGQFGSLDNWTARPTLAPDALVVSRNTEHLRGGAISDRAGRKVEAELAAQRSPVCSPTLERQQNEPTGSLDIGTTYYAVGTYVTSAGETDDLYSGDLGIAGQPITQFTATANAVQLSMLMHVRRAGIEWTGVDGSGFIVFRLDQPDPELYNGSPVEACDEALYRGWLVYPRSPRLVDETNLGANPDAATPLYHRVKPWATVTSYNQTTRTFTVDKRLDEIGETGWIDKDLVDIMMPDRDGLPILSYNIYLSLDAVEFRLARKPDGTTATWNTGLTPCIVGEYDPDGQLAPSTRIDRTAPTVNVIDSTEVGQGRCGPQAADSRIPASIVQLRTTWTTGDLDLMGDPGFSEQCRLNGACPDRPPLRAFQETYPSNQTVAMVGDGQSIEVTANGEPDINVGWNLYGRVLRPFRVMTFEGSYRPATQTVSPRRFRQNSAVYFYGDLTVPTLPVDNFASGPDSAFGGGALYDEYRNNSEIIDNNLDPFDKATRGFPPGYPDVRETLDPSGDPYFSFASSRDEICKNRYLYWWYWDAVTDSVDLAKVTHAILRITMRVRPGRLSEGAVPGSPLFEAGQDRNVSLRVWDEGGADWTVLKDQMGLDRWFVRRGLPIEWDASMLIQGQDPGGAPNTARYLVFDVKALESVGFDVDDVSLELYAASEPEGEAPPHPDMVLQRGGDQPIVTPSYTLQNPLVERTYLTDGSPIGTGEWKSLWPNNTAQWPMTVVALPIVGKGARSKETKTNFVGVADSIFRDRGDSTLERVFQIEGKEWNEWLRHDSREENYLNRVFICNEGEHRWNYRFDGLATYVMGLPKPGSAVTTDDILLGFGTGQGDPASPPSYNDRCQLAEQFPGVIVAVNETDTPEGETDPSGNIVIGFDIEYYVVYKRYDPATGRSYVVRSEPAQLTATRRLRGSDDFPPSVLVNAWLSPEPQVTHIEVYRNNFMTADYYLVSDLILPASGTIPDYNAEGIRITDALVDQATGRVFLSFTDIIPTDSADLTLPIDFETGRPTAAVMMKENRGRIFFSQQRERMIVAWTNITSPSGAVNPEGFYVQHVQPLPLRETSAITCFSVYNGIVAAHCNTGISGITGISDDLNSAAGLSFEQLASDGGWMGPDAFCDVDNVQYGMTRQGPARLFGSELVYVGDRVQGTTSGATMTTDALFGVRCVHYRTASRSQVWFTYLDEPGGAYQQCLVFDESPDARGELLWKTWTEMPVHGLTSARDSDGNEYPLLGGQDGRLYAHGGAGSDCGMLIEFDLVTRPFESPKASASFQPRWAYFYTSGAPEDFASVDIIGDMSDIPRNALPIPLQMGGNCGLLWSEAVGGSGDQWGGDGQRPWTNERMNVGGTFQQIAFRLYRTWATWKVGNARDAGFESTGFNPYDAQAGPRTARANAGARR